MPHGLIAEDGLIPNKYVRNMWEARHKGYSARTKLNVKEADCTLIFTYGNPRGGSLLTYRYAIANGICMHFDLNTKTDDEIVRFIRTIINDNAINVLNIAGSRESVAPGIYARVKQILIKALDK